MVEKEETQFNKDAPQSVEVIFTGTGDKGYDMPDNLQIKINQLTDRQLLYAAVSLMQHTFKEFESANGDVRYFLAKTFLKAEFGMAVMEKMKKASEQPKDKE